MNQKPDDGKEDRKEVYIIDIEAGWPRRNNGLVQRLLLEKILREGGKAVLVTGELSTADVLGRLAEAERREFPLMTVELPRLREAARERPEDFHTVFSEEVFRRGMEALSHPRVLPDSWFDSLARASIPSPVDDGRFPAKRIRGFRDAGGASPSTNWSKTDSTLPLKERRKQKARLDKADRRKGRR